MHYSPFCGSIKAIELILCSYLSTFKSSSFYSTVYEERKDEVRCHLGSHRDLDSLCELVDALQHRRTSIGSEIDIFRGIVPA